jgi:AraC-like DNA-binding protein
VTADRLDEAHDRRGYHREVAASYREFASPRGLEDVVGCLWENDRVRLEPQLVVPDGCIDLVWFGSDGLKVVGADTGPHTVEPLGSSTVGIRLRPGAAGAVLGIPASEVRDQQVDLSLVWRSQTLADRMSTASPSQRLGLLARSVWGRRAVPDRLVAAAARSLARPSSRVGQVAAELGVSERQLRRRTTEAIGYGPKTLARVARLRRLTALDGEELAVRAVLAGYASQAHMSEEVRRLTGLTPVRFLKDAGHIAA